MPPRRALGRSPAAVTAHQEEPVSVDADDSLARHAVVALMAGLATAHPAGAVELALRAHLLPAFGGRPIESITAEDVESWRRSLIGLSSRSKNKLLIELHGIFGGLRWCGVITVNPLARVEKHPMRPSGDI